MTSIGNVSGLNNVLSRINELERMGNPTKGADFAQVLGNVTAQASAAGGASVSGPDLAAMGAAQSGTAVGQALAWGAGEVGTPYAAVNPFRFGDVPWDGGKHLSVNGSGTVFQYPKGTKVYDCSGYATTLWRKAGIDLADFNATTSASMLANIPRVDRSQARAGDLVIFDTDDDGNPNHVGVLDGTGMMLDAQPTGGVQRREVKWEKALGVVRPSLLRPDAAQAFNPAAQLPGQAQLQAQLASLLS